MIKLRSEGDLDILVLGFNEVLYPDSDNPTPAIDVQGKLNIYGGEGDERDPKLVENRLQLFGDPDEVEPALFIPGDPDDVVIGGSNSNLVVEIMEGFGPSDEELTVANPGLNFYIRDGGNGGPPPGPPMGFAPIQIYIGDMLVLDDAHCGTPTPEGDWQWDSEDCNPFFEHGIGFAPSENDSRWSATAGDGSWTLEPKWSHGPEFTSPDAFDITVTGSMKEVKVVGGSDWRFVNFEGANPNATVAANDNGFSVVAEDNGDVDVANVQIGKDASLLGGVSSEGRVDGSGGQIGTADNPSPKGVEAQQFTVEFDGFTMHTSGPAFVGADGAMGGPQGAEKPGMEVWADGGTLTVRTTADPATVNTGYMLVRQGGVIDMNYPGDLGEGATPAALYFDDGAFSENPEENEEHQRLGNAVAKVGDHPEFQYKYAESKTGFVLTSTMGELALFQVFSNTPNGTFEIEAARGYIFGSYEPPGATGFRQIQYMIEVGSTVTMKASPDVTYQFIDGILQTMPADEGEGPMPPEEGAVGAAQGEAGPPVPEEIPVEPEVDGNVATYTFEMPDAFLEAQLEFNEYGSSAIVEEDLEAAIGEAALGDLDNNDIADLDPTFGGTARLDISEATVTDAQKAAFEKAAGDRTVGEYLDLTLNQVVLQGTDNPAQAWVKDGEIEELQKAVEVTLDLDGTLAGHSDYLVLREHKDGIEALEATYVNGKLSFETDQFSTYAIAFEGAPKAELEVNRFAGKNRYDTNYALVKDTFKAGQPVFVATGALFPDALSVGPAAASEGGVLVLAPKAGMKADMLKLLKERAPSKIYIIGGKGAVSSKVEAQLKKIGTVERIGGKDRYDTSLKVFEKFFAGKTFDEAFVATGALFPDALTASAAGGTVGAPVLLVKGTTGKALLPKMVTGLKTAKVKTVNIVGGTGAVNKTIATSLTKEGFNVERLGGVNRYETNMVVNDFLNKGGALADVTGVWIATGQNFPDALTAAVPAGSTTQRLVLSNGTCIPKPVVSEWVEGSTSKVTNVNLVGGTGVLKKSVEQLTECK